MMTNEEKERVEKIKRRVNEFREIGWGGNELGDFVSSSDVIFLVNQVEKKEEMNPKKFELLMYALIKEASNYGFTDYLEGIGLDKRDYDEIKKHLEETYGMKMYI